MGNELSINPPIAYAQSVDELSRESEPILECEYSPPRRGLGRAAPVAVFATAIPILGSVTMLIAGPLLAHWLRAQGVFGVIYFTLTFALLGSIAFAPTYTTSVIAGWTFGFRWGFPAVVLGTVGGAVLCFFVARHLARERVASTFQSHPKWEVVRRALLEESSLKTLWIVFLLRLSPVLPFGTTNVLLATTGVRFWVYVMGTLLGLAPRMGLVALAAASAERLDFDSTESWWFLGISATATCICIVVMIMIGQRALHRATRSPKPAI